MSDIDHGRKSVPGAGLAAFGLVLSGVLALQGCGPAKSGGQATAQLTPPQICLQATEPTTAAIDACRSAMAYDANDAAIRRRIGLLRLKSGSLSAARQAYQIARSIDPKDAEAQFGLGLTLEAIGEAGGNLQKAEAVKRDPTVVDRFRKLGIEEDDLMTFDTAPKILTAPRTRVVREMSPKLPLTSSLGVDVKCLISKTGGLHDCKVITPLTQAQAPFGEAAKKIVVLSKVSPARDKGEPVADAPIVLTMVFEP